MPENDIDRVTIVINTPDGDEIGRYRGKLLDRRDGEVLLETSYEGEERQIGEATLREGSRLVIRFFEDRVYSIMEMHRALDDALLGWYCDFMRPAEIDDDEVRAVDLGLGLFVDADRGTRVEGRDTFDALPLTDEERQDVENSLAALLQKVAESAPPFGTQQPIRRPADQGMPGPDENLPKDPKRSLNPDAPGQDWP